MCSFSEDPVFNLIKQDNQQVNSVNLFLTFFQNLIIFLFPIQLNEDSYFATALKKLKLKEFDSITELCTKEIESETVKKVLYESAVPVRLSGYISPHNFFQVDIEIRRLAKLLRGTFLSLLGEHEKALEDFSAVFDDPQTDAKVT